MSRHADVGQSSNVIEHAPSCFWLRAEPSVDGDEGACCDCGAYVVAAVAFWAAAWEREAASKGY